jgi:uroporphyrinogen-III synthase
MNKRRRVVLTREAPHNDELATALSAHVRVSEVELTRTQFRSLADVTDDLGGLIERGLFQTVAVTSRRAARYVDAALAVATVDARVAVVGASTRDAVVAQSPHAAQRIMTPPQISNAAGLGAVIDRGPVLALGAEQARSELVDALGEKGLTSESVICYRTVAAPLSRRKRRRLQRADIVVIFAPSAWESAKTTVGPHTHVVAVGETTADAVRRDHAALSIAESPRRDDVLALILQLSGAQQRAVG